MNATFDQHEGDHGNRVAARFVSHLVKKVRAFQ
jgi:hypothetical protein